MLYKMAMKKGLFPQAIIIGLLLLSGCSAFTSTEVPPPTLTLAPNVSRTPRFTATPIPTVDHNRTRARARNTQEVAR